MDEEYNSMDECDSIGEHIEEEEEECNSRDEEEYNFKDEDGTFNLKDEDEEYNIIQDGEPPQNRLVKFSLSTEGSATSLTTDFADIFNSNVPEFLNREELIEWVREKGRENRMAIVVQQSVLGRGKKKSRVWLGCDQGGVYREPKVKANRFKPGCEGGITCELKRETGTRKNKCPFLIKAAEESILGPWKIIDPA